MGGLRPHDGAASRLQFGQAAAPGQEAWLPEVAPLVLEFVAPLRSLFSVQASCRAFAQAGRQLRPSLERQWAALLPGADPLAAARPSGCFGAWRWLAAQDFAGRWRQRSFDGDGDPEAPGAEGAVGPAGAELCSFEYELLPAEPPAWEDLQLEDRTFVRPPFTLEGQAQPLVLRRSPGRPPDPVLRLRGYKGQGLFRQQTFWNSDVPFVVEGWSCGGELCLQITWSNGTMGRSFERLVASWPDAEAMGPLARCLRGRFVNFDGVIASYEGEVTLERLPAIVDDAAAS